MRPRRADENGHKSRRTSTDNPEHNGDITMFMAEFLSSTFINAILIALALIVLAGRF